MFEISYPNNTEDIIDKIRATIGRPVLFYTQVSVSGCSSCTLDPVTGTSTDSFCNACGGDYYIPTYSEVTVSGHVTWKDSAELDWQTGGQLFKGDCRVQIKYSDRNVGLVTRSGYVVVDGKTLSIENTIYKGVPDLNRIVVNLEMKEGK